MSAVQQFLDGLDHRTGYRKLINSALDEPLPGGASWAYVFGSAALVLFLVQFATGVVLATFYSPSATDAWASIAYIESHVAMGSVVRGIHHHAAGGMVVILVLHMTQVVVYGAYKAPREVNWLFGLGLLGLVQGFALTGYLLPWDQTGYWATKVATGIVGTVPVLGEYLQRFLQGGNDYGNLTLTRFYALHVIVLPLLTFGLIGAHMAVFRRHGVTPAAGLSEEALAAKSDRFWPKQVAYDAVFAAVIVGFVIFVAASVGAPLQAPADPASNFIARPEWYFLFLFQLLKYFDGPLQVVGTTIIPSIGAAYLAALPFLDRAKGRSLRQRIPWVASYFAGIAAVALLTVAAIVSDANDQTLEAQQKTSRALAARAIALAADGVPTEGAAYMMQQDPLTRGEKVFRGECMSCHAFEGVAPEKIVAPDLTAFGTRAWIRQVLRDPQSPRLFGGTKLEGMPSYVDLPAAEFEKLVDLVYALRDGAPLADEGPQAALVEAHGCGDCHDFEEAAILEGPALIGYQGESWIRSLISDCHTEAHYGEDCTMPMYGDGRLSDQDIDAAATFLLSIPRRTPQKVWPYVDDPGAVTTELRPDSDDE